jgi:hypothetical protein
MYKSRDRIKHFLQMQQSRINELLQLIEQSERRTSDHPEHYTQRQTKEELELAANLREMGFDHLEIPLADIWSELHEINKKLDNPQFTCRFAQQDTGVMQMMVASKNVDAESRQAGIKEIRDFTYKASQLIVIDPYLYGGESEERSAMKYLEDFEKSSRINQLSLKELHVIYSSSHGQTKNIKHGIKRLANDYGCEYTESNTDKIHDRIWIKDRKDAIVVGTSLRGLGNRLCFILPLPQYDLQALLEYLKEQSLI